MNLSEHRFDIVRPLGSGSMGLVFEAVDKETKTRVALKTLRSLSAEALARFKAEFRDFQHLSHPNLVSLGELLYDDGTWFFSMELVEGCSLIEWVRGGNRERNETVKLERLPRPVLRDSQTITRDGGVSTTEAVSTQVSWGTFDEERTRSSLLQLARGLCALHDAGKVHRDLKPENVMVTPTSRVVVVDFGLGIDSENAGNDEHEIVGTVGYMSPEQAAARRLTPASDWYAFGTILFEALTGCLPFVGSPFAVLAAKQTQDAPLVRSLAPDAPKDLADLADALLKHDPTVRPKAQHVLAVLSGSVLGQSPTASLGQVFVGRERELERLVQAAQRIRDGKGPRVVLVVGESGLGKTSLLRQFDRRLRREITGSWHLKGVCYERESTPYKGIDGALDELAANLSDVQTGVVRDLLPDDVMLLAEFFPVLGRVLPLDHTARELSTQREPVLLRARLFSAVRALLSRSSRDRLVLFQIEDLQWANADSWALLSALLTSPAAASLGFIFSLRSEDPRAVDCQQRLEALAPGGLEVVRLERFTTAEGDALARTLLERLGTDTSSASVIAREADGHPLFIDALVRAGEVPLGGKLTLDEALWQRRRQLPESAQTVLSLVALSNSALVQQAVARAANLPPAEFNRQVAALRVLHFVRSSGVRQLDTVVPFHDRVRVAVRARLDPNEVKQLHRRLALALEGTASTDLEALVWHWSEANEPARAAAAAERAGEQAATRLAFDRAAELFGDAIALSGPSAVDRLRLWSLRGEALTNAGRGGEAAAAFLEAAGLADRATALGFQRRAADQLLRSGHIDDGLARLRDVLRAVGEGLADGPVQALASLVWGRARLALRGLTFKERTKDQIPPDSLMRVDATWSAANGLSSVDLIRGAEMQARNLRLSLEAGELSRVARALSMESGIYSFAGPSARSKAMALNDRARALCDRLGDPLAIAFVTLIRGVIEFQNLDWAAAEPLVSAGLAQLEQHRAGAWWELTTARMFRLMTLYYLGRLREITLALPNWVDESQRRDDLYALTNMRLSHCSVTSLMADDPRRGVAEVDAVMRRWSPRGYLAQHYYALLARVSAELYRGDGSAAHQRVEDEWGQLERSQLLRSFVLSVEAPQLRARAAIAEGSARSLTQATAIAKRLEGIGTRASTAFAIAIRAGVASRAGRKTEAHETLGRAARAFEAANMGLHSQTALLLIGGDAGQKARHDFEAQGIVNPDAFSGYVLPGFS
jgi:eukaryotic-like serine/threonine-protein kinase